VLALARGNDRPDSLYKLIMPLKQVLRKPDAAGIGIEDKDSRVIGIFHDIDRLTRAFRYDPAVAPVAHVPFAALVPDTPVDITNI